VIEPLPEAIPTQPMTARHRRGLLEFLHPVSIATKFDPVDEIAIATTHHDLTVRFGFGLADSAARFGAVGTRMTN